MKKVFILMMGIFTGAVATAQNSYFNSYYSDGINEAEASIYAQNDAYKDRNRPMFPIHSKKKQEQQINGQVNSQKATDTEGVTAEEASIYAQNDAYKDRLQPLFPLHRRANNSVEHKSKGDKKKRSKKDFSS